MNKEWKLIVETLHIWYHNIDLVILIICSWLFLHGEGLLGRCYRFLVSARAKILVQAGSRYILDEHWVAYIISCKS